MMIYITALLLSACTIQICVGLGLMAGKVGFYDIRDLSICANEMGTEMEVSIEQDGDIKYAKGKIKTLFDYTDDMEFKLNVDRWSGSEWKKNFLVMEGNVCKMVTKIIPDMYVHLLQSFTPAIQTESHVCTFPQGDYFFNKFTAKAEEVKIPGIVYSKYRGKLIYLKDGKIAACLEGEADAKA